MPYVYILRCSDGSYYVGSTNDIDLRLAEHDDGLGGRHTMRRRPVELAFCQWYDRVSEAYAMERRLHGWSRAKKEAIIAGRWDALPGLARRRSRAGPEHTAASG